MPHNWRPVGSERVQVDGYMMVKIAEPKTWILKQHYVWQKANGQIEKDEIIVFLDGNRQNCELSNLRKISRKIHGIINHLHLTYCDAQTFESACAVARLSAATQEAKRRRKKKR